MSDTITRKRRSIEMAPGYRAAEVASFLAQLDDQTRRVTEDTRGLDAAALAWQPAPGLNSIGMLLAHIAIVEVYWTAIMMRIEDDRAEIERAIGIGMDDDGMPIPPGGAPPENLRGKELAYFDDLMARARVYLKGHAMGLTEADLAVEVERKGKDTLWTIDRRWILYHLLEHFAGHYGQILLLRHQYDVARGA